MDQCSLRTSVHCIVCPMITLNHKTLKGNVYRDPLIGIFLQYNVILAKLVICHQHLLEHTFSYFLSPNCIKLFKLNSNYHNMNWWKFNLPSLAFETVWKKIDWDCSDIVQLKQQLQSPNDGDGGRVIVVGLLLLLPGFKDIWGFMRAVRKVEKHLIFCLPNRIGVSFWWL